MSITCNTCGHDNQDDALFCDECGEELAIDTLSPEEENTILQEPHIEVGDNEAIVEDRHAYAEVGDNEIAVEDRPHAYAEVGDNEIAVEDNAYSEVSNNQDEAAFNYNSDVESSDNEIAIGETEETEPSLRVGAATRLELDEPPIQEMVSPATTLQLPELPKAVLIDRQTEEKIILPAEEKTVYVGRLNDEFPVQVDLSNIDDADLISRVHAAIHHERDNYYLEDAGSANGTWLNEEQIQPGIRFRQQLNSGDTIAFGRNQTIKFTFNLED